METTKNNGVIVYLLCSINYEIKNTPGFHLIHPHILGCSYSSSNASTLTMEAASYCRMSELFSSKHNISVEEDMEYPSTPLSEPQISCTLTFSGAPVSSLLRHCTTCDMSSHGRPSSET